MAAKYTATIVDTDREMVHRRAGAVPAYAVSCDCATCAGRTVLVPAATVTSKATKLALHNYVAQSRVLGFPAA